jgi:hypothetical protein
MEKQLKNNLYMVLIVLIVFLFFYGLFVGWMLSCFYHPYDFLNTSHDNRVHYCYQNSPCTTYIYLEQQVGCYKGCQIALDNADVCEDKCIEYYQDKYKEYD